MNMRNRLFIQRSLDSLMAVSDDHQHELNNLASLGAEPESLGRLLQISRTIDTIERVSGELHALLDQPPADGGAKLGLLPRPARALDRAA
jgi:hypothetical protein